MRKRYRSRRQRSEIRFESFLFAAGIFFSECWERSTDISPDWSERGERRRRGKYIAYASLCGHRRRPSRCRPLSLPPSLGYPECFTWANKMKKRERGREKGRPSTGLPTFSVRLKRATLWKDQRKGQSQMIFQAFHCCWAFPWSFISSLLQFWLQRDIKAPK